MGLYFGTAANTSDNEFDIRYFVIDDEGTQFGTRQVPLIYPTPTLLAGENTINMSVSPGVGTQTKDVTLWLSDTYINDFTDGNFSFERSDIFDDSNFPYTLTGGGNPVPSAIDGTSVTRTYIDADVNGEGDYHIDRFQTDPNGTVTAATGNPKVARWAPYLLIYSVDGNLNMRDPLPVTTKSLVTVEYVKKFNVLTDENGNIDYDANGELQLYGGGIIDSVDYPLVEGSNTIIIENGVLGAQPMTLGMSRTRTLNRLPQIYRTYRSSRNRALLFRM